MSGTVKRPLNRRCTLVLSGTKSRFQEDLNWDMRETSRVVIVGYTVLNTPVTGTVPDTPLISIDFEFGPGFELTPQISNYPLQHSIVLPLVAANTQRDCSSGIVLGELRGSRIGQVNMRVKDITGADHHASSNKLFDWIVLEMVLLEAGREPTPLYLKDVPSIQQTLNTI